MFIKTTFHDHNIEHKYNVQLVSVSSVYSTLPFLVLPCRTRTDPGTENPILAQCQMFLRRDGEDEFGGPNSHYTGSSEINQVGNLKHCK